MKTTSITVSYGRTIPTKPYGGDRIDVTIAADLHEDDNFELCAIDLRHEALAQVNAAEAEIRFAIEQAAGQGRG